MVAVTVTRAPIVPLVDVELSQVAQRIGADERTLRRAVATGTVRCTRIGPRRRFVSPEEIAYLERHWELLAELRRALRTEPNVRLAVVYGSFARGTDEQDSDLDVLVALAEDRPDAAVKLAVRLERALGREVDVARLERVEQRAPLLLLEAIDEGRAVVDRDDRWAAVRERRPIVAAQAARAHGARRRRAAAALRELQED